MVKAVLEPNERARLRQFLTDRFSLTELKNLAFDLDVNYELLHHDTTLDLARELVAHLERKDQLGCLVTEIIKRRPDHNLAQLLAKLPSCEVNKRELLEVVGNGSSTPSITMPEQLSSETDKELKAKRNELLIAQRALEKLQNNSDTPEYKIIERQQYIRGLEKQIRKLEEELQTAGQFVQGHAVVVGVGVDLPITIHDATAVADFLRKPDRCAYPSDQVCLLTGSDATRADILSALDRLAQSTTQDSTAIVYFSGHGYRVESPGRPSAFYLIPYGYDTKNLSKTCISGQEFTNKLRAVRSKKLLVLLDCCHAGGVAQPKTPHMTLSKAPLPLQVEVVLAEGSGRIILASSRADEKSYTSDPYSQFTIALLEALAGAGAAEKDGYARVLDIALYVGRMVPNRTNDAQHPILKVSNLENNFALAYYAGGSKEPLPPPKLGEAQSQAVFVSADAEITEGYRTLLNKYRHNLLEIEMQMAEFIDQRAVPPDLLRAREGVIKKIEGLEKQYKK